MAIEFAIKPSFDVAHLVTSLRNGWQDVTHSAKWQSVGQGPCLIDCSAGPVFKCLLNICTPKSVIWSNAVENCGVLTGQLVIIKIPSTLGFLLFDYLLLYLSTDKADDISLYRHIPNLMKVESDFYLLVQRFGDEADFGNEFRYTSFYICTIK